MRCCCGVLALALVAAACGSDGQQSADTTGTGPATTAVAAADEKGAPITEPICDFIGVSAADASGILGFEVSAESKPGSKDQAGGSCTFTPQGGSPDAFEVGVAIFPDTEASFTSYVDKFAQEKSDRTGNDLWTEPEPIAGVGQSAYSLGSPTGGWDSVFVFANGYRILVNDKNKTDVPGAAAKVQALAQAVAANI